MWDDSQLVELAKQLGQVGADVGSKVDQVVRKAAADATAIAQSNAPVDTGNHRASIGWDAVAPGVAEFGPTSNYGEYLEVGTWKMQARPHIFPAADAVIPAMEAALTRLGGDFL